jgi:sarcosine oxidase subunit beta
MGSALRRARVVVIGAGAIGLAVALQLRRAGVEGVLVVDRNASPGMGSTSRANGGVRAQFTTPINITFSRYTIEKLRELHELSGGQVGFRAVGYLFLTGTDAGEIALRRKLGVAAFTRCRRRLAVRRRGSRYHAFRQRRRAVRGHVLRE